ncbi:MAG: hypothetical protein ABL904_10715, partial [Hyphomicrobiaceae bacterium]
LLAQHPQQRRVAFGVHRDGPAVHIQLGHVFLQWKFLMLASSIETNAGYLLGKAGGKPLLQGRP